MSIYVGDLQFVEYLSKLGIYFKLKDMLGIYFKLKDMLVGGMGNVNKYFCAL